MLVAYLVILFYTTYSILGADEPSSNNNNNREEGDQSETNYLEAHVVPRKIENDYPMVRGLIIPLVNGAEEGMRDESMSPDKNLGYESLFREERSSIRPRAFVAPASKMAYYPNYPYYARGYSGYYPNFIPIM